MRARNSVVSGATTSATATATVWPGDRRKERAARGSTGGKVRIAATVNSVTGTRPCITPNATLALMPRPNSSSTTGYSVTLGMV